MSFYGMDGVYIDQIACAEPKPCYDPTHNHSIGGGNHFQAGNNKLLAAAQSKIGGNHIIMTEGQHEYYTGSADIFLTLMGFNAGNFSFSQPMAARNEIVPAHQAIYGGYTLYAGAMFGKPDFNDPNVFAGRLANNFMFGA